MDQNPPLPQVGEREDAYIPLRIRDDADFRDRVIAWLEANGIDHKQVPQDERPSLVDNRLTLRLFTLSAEGRRQFDPRSDRILTHTVAVPVTVAPDAEVARWLVPPCPKCGR